MNSHFKRRRFYSEKLSEKAPERPYKQNPPDFTLPDSPKISNLELIDEIEDFELDAEGDIFSDFLGVDVPIDKASFFNQMVEKSKGEQDSFELEIASKKNQGETPSDKQINKEEGFQGSEEQQNKKLNDFIGQDFKIGDFNGKAKKHIEKTTQMDSHEKRFVPGIQNTQFEINCPMKRKMMQEMFNFKVDVGKNNIGNRLRSQSYSIGQSNSIYDFLNKK